jgi:hypothetical protein
MVRCCSRGAGHARNRCLNCPMGGQGFTAFERPVQITLLPSTWRLVMQSMSTAMLAARLDAGGHYVGLSGWLWG